jgi:hypothetical protein
VETYQINILNPKAAKLLRSLAELELISIKKTSTEDFQSIVDRLRTKAEAAPISMEEITKEVEKVRAKRYAAKK